MLPLNKTLRRDWLDLFTHMVWASVIIIMGMSKLKSSAAAGRALFFAIIVTVVNLEVIGGSSRWYKVYFVSRRVLRKDAVACFAFTCATLYGLPWWGVLGAHLLAWYWGAHLQPAGRIAALYAGNQITPMQRNILIAGQAFGSFSAGVFAFLVYLFATPDALEMASGVEPWHAVVIEVLTTLGLSWLARVTKSDLVSVVLLGGIAAAGCVVGSSHGHALALNPPLFTGTLIYEVLRYGWSWRLVSMALTTVAAWVGTLLPIFIMPKSSEKKV